MNAENFTNEEYWEEIKRKIQREANVSDITYHLWFENLEFRELSGNTVYIVSEKEDERARGTPPTRDVYRDDDVARDPPCFDRSILRRQGSHHRDTRQG